MHHKQNGNVLFLILIAVVLFAALSYAVTQSSRGAGNSNKEKSTIDSSTIMQTVSTIQVALHRLRLVNGCSETEISFHYDSDNDGTLETSDWYYNTNAPTDGSCSFFHNNGGGLNYQQLGIGDNGRGWFFTGAFRLQGVGGDGVADQDLIAAYAVDENTCIAINNQLDLPTSPLGSDWYDQNHRFTGSYYNLNRIADGGGDNAAFEGEAQGCLIHSQPGWSSGATHFYYHVLIER